MIDVDDILESRPAEERAGARVRALLGRAHRRRPDRGRQRRRRRPADPGGARRRRARCRPARASTTRAATTRTPRAPRSARSSPPATRPTRASTTTGAPPSEMKPLLEERMRGASAGKTMYVIPYLMAPPGSPLEQYAAGVELTDTRTVVLHMIRMARVGVRVHQRPRRPGQLRPRRARHRRPGEPRPGHRRRTSATSSPSPTSARSCTSARPTAATRCSARSRTACARPPTTAGRRGKFLAEQFMLHRHHRQGDRQARTTSAAASRAPRARPTSR